MSTITSTTPFAPTHTNSSSPLSLLHKKQKMSITQTYYLAHKARAKLSREAAMPDHDLRLLVGHANLLDSLMLELADAEREQESWFNQSVRSASQPTEKAAADKHIQWADTIDEADEEDCEDSSSSYEDSESNSSSDDDSDISEDEEDVEMVDVVSLRRVPSHHNDMTTKTPASPQMAVVEIEMEDHEEEEDEDYAQLTLTRSPSHHSAPTSPLPELEHDFEESSEDEAMPPSPPMNLLATFEQGKQPTEEELEEQQQKRVSEEFYDDHHTIHYLPARNPARLVSAISVY